MAQVHTKHPDTSRAKGQHRTTWLNVLHMQLHLYSVETVIKLGFWWVNDTDVQRPDSFGYTDDSIVIKSYIYSHSPAQPVLYLRT